MAKLMGLDKMANLAKIIKQNGGIMGSIATLYRTDILKDGDLVGTDKFGNRYYQNNRFFMGTNRWVDYSHKVHLNYDASQIPPEWHRWMQHITDDPPSTHPPLQRKWTLEHEPNYSGDAAKQYIPYSTMRPKIEAWEPSSPPRSGN